MTQHVMNIPNTKITGSRTFGPFAIGSNVTAVISLDRTVNNGLNSLDGTTQLTMTVQSSGDGGATWNDEVSGTWPGGIFTKNGVQVNTATLEVRGIDPSRNSCQAIAVVTGTAASVTIAGSVTAT